MTLLVLLKKVKPILQQIPSHFRWENCPQKILISGVVGFPTQIDVKCLPFFPTGKSTCTSTIASTVLLRTSNLTMDLMLSEDKKFIPPQYVVHSFLFSEHDDSSQLEVRRHGKCFYITMASENFNDSPPIKQQYLSYLAAERSDATDGNSMSSDNNYKSRGLLCMGPLACLPLFETLAPAPPKQNPKPTLTLHDFLHPEETFYYSLRAVDGRLTPV